jgi:hypothetical protein
MHLGLNTIRLLLCYTAALSVSITSSSAAVLVVSVTSQGLTASASHTKPKTTSHSVATHRPHVSTPLLHHPRPPFNPSPASTPSPSPIHHYPLTHHHKTIVIIALALAGLIVLGVLMCIARCMWSWHKTPRRDRIAGLMNRYNLEREMEEAAVEPRRARVRKPPPPPYFPPPPEYAHMMSGPSSLPPVHNDVDTPAEEV